MTKSQGKFKCKECGNKYRQPSSAYCKDCGEIKEMFWQEEYENKIKCKECEKLLEEYERARRGKRV